MLPDWQLRQQIIPMLDTAGLIMQEKDSSDLRVMLITPTNESTEIMNNSESGGGVDNQSVELTQNDMPF